MNRKSLYVLSILAVTLLGACATGLRGPLAQATLVARSGSSVSGKVLFSEGGGKLRVEARVVGLAPGEHGFHIHEVGDCRAPDASSANAHFNPNGKAHGHVDGVEQHGGDMPNLVANARGEAHYSTEVKGLGLNGPNGIFGRSVVIHADPDDYQSQPTGNSGARIACGIIVAR